MGVIAFELWHRFSTGMERAVLLRDLRERDVMPADFEASQPAVCRLIRWMLARSPADRPTARQVLASELLPPSVGDEELADLLRSLPDNPAAHQRVVDAVFGLAAGQGGAAAAVAAAAGGAGGGGDGAAPGLETPGTPLPIDVRGGAVGLFWDGDVGGVWRGVRKLKHSEAKVLLLVRPKGQGRWGCWKGPATVHESPMEIFFTHTHTLRDHPPKM